MGDKEVIITIIGTRNLKKVDEGEFKIYNKQEIIKRVEELLDEDYMFSVVSARK